MLPRITIEARVAAEPELRFSPSGVAVGRLRLVTSDRRKNEQTQQWEDGNTLWLDCTCFKQLAENVVESIEKGDLVVVTGKLQTEEWTSPEGEKRSKVALIADTVSASLAFRTIPHGAGKATRPTQGQRAATGSQAAAEPDPWATAGPASGGQGFNDDPPF